MISSEGLGVGAFLWLLYIADLDRFFFFFFYYLHALEVTDLLHQFQYPCVAEISVVAAVRDWRYASMRRECTHLLNFSQSWSVCSFDGFSASFRILGRNNSYR